MHPPCLNSLRNLLEVAQTDADCASIVKLIIGNWKLNPSSLNGAVALAAGVSFKVSSQMYDSFVLLPPFVFIEELAKKFKHINWGAQDFFWESAGAFTGEISLPMLKDIGASWVLVGHSERRRLFGEDDEMVNKKMKVALENGFNVIAAVGELHKGDYSGEIVSGFKKTVEGASEEHLSKLVVAYEPVWAIGTGEPDEPSRSNQIIGQLKIAAFKLFGEPSKKIRYIYGGSVDSRNAERFLSQPNIGGALVGGASLNQAEFLNILKIAQSS